MEPDEKRLFVAQRAYLYPRPRFSSSTSAHDKSPPPQKSPLKTNPKPGCGLGPVYCIVDSLNTRVQLLRTKQRLFRSAGMLAAVAEPLASPPPTHLSKIPHGNTHDHSDPAAACFRVRLFWPGPVANIIFPLPYLG